MGAPALEDAVEALYRVFGRHPPPPRASGCTRCWSDEENAALAAAPPRTIAPDLVSKLLYETADHWDSAEAYQHYLPRMLESLTPAVGVEDMYPAHVFETLLALGATGWPDDERRALLGFFAALEAVLDAAPGLAGEDDRVEWRTAVKIFRERMALGQHP